RLAVAPTSHARWLRARALRWSGTRRLAPGRRLRSVPVVTDDFDSEYRVGSLAGMTLGDGTFRYEPGWRSDKLGFTAAYRRVALADQEPLLRLVTYLEHLGIAARLRPFRGGGRRAMDVEVRSLARLAVIHALLEVEREIPSWRRGFLAGFFDAEGYHGGSLRLSQVDVAVLERVQRYAAALGFTFVLEHRPGKASTLRLAGRLVDRIRFFSTCRPAIARKLGALYGMEMNVDPEPVLAVEPGPVADVVDIQTSTGT